MTSARALAAVGIVLTLWACAQPLSGGAGSTGEASPGGSLSLVVGSPGTQTVLPDVDTTPVSYRFVGTGPDGATFTVDAADGATAVTDLRAGTWTVEARGLNSSGFLVAHGQADAVVSDDARTQVSIPVTRVDGTGTLVITARWNPDHTVAPTASADITDSFGHTTSVDLPVTEPGVASATVDAVSAGYHRLALELTDSGSVIMGAGETVRVVAEASTTVDLEFVDVNKVGQPVQVTADSFTIAWDPPVDSTPDAYRVYTRPRGTYSWNLLQEVTATQLVVSSSMLAYDTYEIAVSAVASGTESEKHTSMDDDAQPSTGWYVEFIGP